MDSELLKQAIADAKAVRATALANAKAALEEAFAPKLQSMLATKLQQEIADEEVDDVAPTADAPVDAPVDDVPVTDEVPVSDVPIGDDVAPTDDGLGLDAPVVDDVAAPEARDGLPGEEIEEDVLGQGNIDPVSQTEELTEEDSSDYKKMTKGHKTEDPQGAKIVVKKIEGTKAAPTSAPSDPKSAKAGYKTPDPQGSSNEFTKGPGKADQNVTGKVLEEDDDLGDFENDGTLESILRELESEVNGPQDNGELPVEAAPQADAGQSNLPTPAADPAAGAEEEINLDELLSESDDEDDKEEKKDDDKDEKSDRGNKEPWMKENKILRAENAEYRKAVGFLRDRINEVNLLNAKLLYTNRLFKSASLSKDQKIQVIESFDLTKSVREAKLIYVALAESLSFGATKKVVVAAAPAKKLAPTAFKAITEGLASKVVASTKSTKAATVLNEGSEMANRFKKLAGISK